MSNLQVENNLDEVFHDAEEDLFFDTLEDLQADPSVPQDVSSATSQVSNYVANELDTLPERLDGFTQDAGEILASTLSPDKLQRLSAAYDELAGKESAAGKKSVLQDAKDLFNVHVGSVIRETKHDLLRGSALQKIGTSLSFAGRAWEGVSIFWNELAKKKPALKVLHNTIVKPIVVALYSAILPELAVVKACEFVGKSICAVAKGGGWKSVAKVATNMVRSTSKHFERIFGTKDKVELAESIDELNIDESSKALMQSMLTYDKVSEVVSGTIDKPSAEFMCGVIIAAKFNGMKIEKAIKLAEPLAKQIDDSPNPIDTTLVVTSVMVAAKSNGMSLKDSIALASSLIESIPQEVDSKNMAAVIAGAAIAAKSNGMDLKDTIGLTQDIISGKCLDAVKVNIKALCEDKTNTFARDLAAVFETSTGHLPNAPRPLKDVVGSIEKSSNVSSEIKQNLIKAISAHIINETAQVIAKPQEQKAVQKTKRKEKSNSAQNEHGIRL